MLLLHSPACADDDLLLVALNGVKFMKISIEDLATIVHPDATVAWDRDVAEHVDTTHSVRLYTGTTPCISLFSGPLNEAHISWRWEPDATPPRWRRYDDQP